MVWWREKNDNNCNDINLFSDKRPATHRQRRSIVSIDDVDHLMELRSARRRSMVLLMNDDIDISSRSNGGNNNNARAFWKNVSPQNIRNLVKTNSSTVEENVLQNPVPKLGKQKQKHDYDSEAVTTVDESCPSRLSSSTSISSSRSSSTSSCGTIPLPENRIPLWCKKINAISRWEHRQEQAYHDTLDERQKMKERQQQHNQWGRYWPGRKQSIRDGLDFSRDVHLASGGSIRAFADSFREPCTIDDDLNNKNDVNDMDHKNNNNANHNNGYLQDTRPSSSPKTQKCVLDLIA
mmetsp:Transcript_55032/g.61487  ORF Transcript_55032/g.61487 Transcript_55032/m.61487 type:complete len:293 (-) Transcript_55032:180-1058(-)